MFLVEISRIKLGIATCLHFVSHFLFSFNFPPKLCEQLSYLAMTFCVSDYLHNISILFPLVLCNVLLAEKLDFGCSLVASYDHQNNWSQCETCSLQNVKDIV